MEWVGLTVFARYRATPAANAVAPLHRFQSDFFARPAHHSRGLATLRQRLGSRLRAMPPPAWGNEATATRRFEKGCGGYQISEFEKLEFFSRAGGAGGSASLARKCCKSLIASTDSAINGLSKIRAYLAYPESMKSRLI
jgi:hypothetical protein